MAALLSGDTEKARAEAAKACDADHRNHIPHVVLAATGVVRQDLEMAQAALTSAFRIRPDLSDIEIRAVVGREIQMHLSSLVEAVRAQRAP